MKTEEKRLRYIRRKREGRRILFVMIRPSKSSQPFVVDVSPSAADGYTLNSSNRHPFKMQVSMLHRESQMSVRMAAALPFIFVSFTPVVFDLHRLRLELFYRAF
jgi:hypothetical protein